MALVQIGGTNGYGFVNKKRLPDGTSQAVTNVIDYSSIGNMRSALAGFDSTYFTADMLAKMTDNDMAYALRVLKDGNISANGTI